MDLSADILDINLWKGGDNNTVNFKLLLVRLYGTCCPPSKRRGQMWEFLNLFKCNNVNFCNYNPKRQGCSGWWLRLSNVNVCNIDTRAHVCVYISICTHTMFVHVMSSVNKPFHSLNNQHVLHWLSLSISSWNLSASSDHIT